MGENIDRLAVFEKSIKTLRELTETQCSSGNWDYDAYMHGMANGMIFALSLFDDKRPDYLDPPAVWLCDMPEIDAPTAESDGLNKAVKP